jgi:hypothetical protein
MGKFIFGFAVGVGVCVCWWMYVCSRLGTREQEETDVDE